MTNAMSSVVDYWYYWAFHFLWSSVVSLFPSCALSLSVSLAGVWPGCCNWTHLPVSAYGTEPCLHFSLCMHVYLHACVFVCVFPQVFPSQFIVYGLCCFSDAFLFIEHQVKLFSIHFDRVSFRDASYESLWIYNKPSPSLCIYCRFASWLLLTFLSLKTIPVVNLAELSATHFLMFKLPAEYCFWTDGLNMQSH